MQTPIGTITEVCFTYALDGGLWIRRKGYAQADWFSFAYLIKVLGEETTNKLNQIACPNIYTGFWYKVND